MLLRHAAQQLVESGVGRRRRAPAVAVQQTQDGSVCVVMVVGRRLLVGEVDSGVSAT